MIRTRLRRASKFRRCGDCSRPIQKGERYLEHVASPGHGDLNNPGWIRMGECLLCAQGYGRYNPDPLIVEAHAGKVHDLG